MSNQPSFEEVCELGKNLGLPRPIANRKSYEKWFLALHELGHHAVKPIWYRKYSDIIYYNPTQNDKPCAPLAADIWLETDPTLDEHDVRAWTIIVCKHYGWTNPILEDPSIFGGTNYNPRQWYITDLDFHRMRLKNFGIDIEAKVFTSNMDDIRLPYPNGRKLFEILKNHDSIYQYYGLENRTSNYSIEHMAWLKYLSSQITS